jgi:hypothetical protein
MHIGESVQLTLTLDGSADSDPDLTPLKRDFEIVGQSQSSNIQIINGSMKRSTQWLITLMPRQTGHLSIPPIHAGALVSARQHIEVLPEASQQTPNGVAPDVFLDVSAVPQDVYVQQQVLCTVRLFRAVDLAQAQLTEPDVQQATVERLGQDATYKTQHQGRTYVVTERRYAIFPQKHGELTIPALQFSGRAGSAVGLFMQPGRMLRKSSAPIALHVHAIPATWPAAYAWLPASDMQLTEEGVTGSNVHVGDAMTRQLQLQAVGLTGAQLPPIATGDIPAAFRAYPDKPVLSDSQQATGMVGTRQEKTALMASQSGTFTLPAIKLPWWNTNTGQIQYASIPARTITILPATNSAATPPPAAASVPVQSTQSTTVTPTPVRDVATPSSWDGWRWLALFTSAGWLLTLLWLAYRHYKQSRAQQATKTEQLQREKTARKQALQACLRNDAEAAYRALLAWAACINPQQANNINQLAQFMQHDQASWLTALQDLDRHRYSPSTQAWDGTVLSQLLQQFNPKHHQEETTAALPPLR